MSFGDHESDHTNDASHEPHAPASVASTHERKEPRVHRIPVRHIPMRETEKPPKGDIDKSLRAIYLDEDGEFPDMTKIEHRKSRFWLVALLSVVFLGILGGAAYVGYLVFSPYVMHASAKLALRIEAADSVAGFEETSLTVTYENVSRTDVGGGVLRVNVPQEFHVISSEPLAGPDGSFAIEPLPAGKSGSVTLNGYYTGENGARAFTQAVARYHPQGMKTTYEDIATRTVALNGSRLTLSIDVPNESVAGETTTFTYRVKNTATVAVENITLVPNFPTDFLIATTQPDPSDTGVFSVGALSPGQEAKVIVTGSFSSNHSDNETIGGSVQVGRGAIAAKQGEAVMPVHVLSSDFQLQTVVNGSSEDQSLDFGKRIRLSGLYKNDGKNVMKNVTLTFTVEAKPDGLIDWKSFDEETKDDKSFMRKGSSIIVTPKLNPAFSDLAPGASGTLSYTIPLAKGALAGAQDYRIKISSHASIAAVGKVKVTKAVETTPFTVTPNSDLALTGGSHYFGEDETTLGSGPLPPSVGAATKYAILWSIANSVHDLKDLTLKTQLPDGVEWSGETTADGGTIGYDAMTRTVTWKVDAIGRATPTLNGKFNVTVTPKQTQQDSYAPLTTGALLSATDTVTKTTLTRTLDPDTTECANDDKVKGKGLVVPAAEAVTANP